MSNFKGHALGGITAALAVGGGLWATGHSPNIIMSGATATFLFSLFPDLDVKSTPSKVFYYIVFIALSWLYYTDEHRLAHLIAMVALIPQLVNHRGILHSRITSIVLPLATVFLAPLGIATPHDALILGGCGVLGYNVHLALDRIWF